VAVTDSPDADEGLSFDGASFFSSPRTASREPAMSNANPTDDELLAAGAILLVDRNHPNWVAVLPVSKVMVDLNGVKLHPIAVAVDSTDTAANKAWTDRIARLGQTVRPMTKLVLQPQSYPAEVAGE